MFYLASVVLAGSALFKDSSSITATPSLEPVSLTEETSIAESHLELASLPDNITIAAAPPPNSPPSPIQDQYSSRLKWGASYTHVSFKPEEHNTLNGNLGGLQGLYEYRSHNGFYAGVQLVWKQGTMEGSAPDRSLLYIDTQERIGGHMSLPSMRGEWTFFAGLGYRHLGHEVKSHPSLSLQYNEFYVPIGLEMEYQVSSCFSWDLNFVWMPQFFPSLWINPGRGANWSLTPQLVNFFVEMPFSFTLTKDRRWHLDLAPFYEHWENGHSTAKSSSGTSLGIPKNNYEFFGLNINASYSF